MDLINKEFENLLENWYLTENISILLYSWVRTTRPTSVLEIGAGFSTICIAKAFDDIRKEEFNPKHNKNIWNFMHKSSNMPSRLIEQKCFEWYDKTFVENSSHSGAMYNPILVTIDNSISNEQSKINCFNSVKTVLEKLNLLKYTHFIENDWLDEINKMSQDKTYDFIWIDIGSGLEHKDWFDILFQKLNPGGTIAFHNVATNLASRYFLSQMKLRCKMTDDFEMITLYEPHKKRQNGIVFFTKSLDYPIHNMVAL